MYFYIKSNVRVKICKGSDYWMKLQYKVFIFGKIPFWKTVRTLYSRAFSKLIKIESAEERFLRFASEGQEYKSLKLEKRSEIRAVRASNDFR